MRLFIINILGTIPCHFIDQTTEATILEFGLGVLNSIRMKMGKIKHIHVLIKEFI